MTQMRRREVYATPCVWAKQGGMVTFWRPCLASALPVEGEGT
jgi:hypothetical protein